MTKGWLLGAVNKFFFILMLLSFSIPLLHAQQEITSEDNVLPQFVFEVSHINYAWGYQYHGLYIDNKGDIYSFSDKRDMRLGEPDRLTEKVMQESHLQNNQLVGQVNAGDLYKKYDLSKTLKSENFSTVSRCADFGAHQYIVYRKKGGQYTPIVLYQAGDMAGKDPTAEAQELFHWLVDVTGEHPNDDCAP
jgi:hypothetical protein